jgi:squalene synthase HpnC
MTQIAIQSASSASTAALGWSRLPSSYAIPPTPPSLAEAQQYCARLARTHYENFSVATWFLPKRLRQDFFNVYAYCRISDDLGDEVGDPKAALALLDEWQAELDQCYAGSPRHPVFVALAETVRKFEIPKHEFADLLIAFRQDQTVTRFETFNDVLSYCRHSANPVGHLVLYLCGYHDSERQQLSDNTCTALQLANFWQDVTVDYAKGRIYLPLEDMRRFNVSEDDILCSRNTMHFRGLMRFEVERAREWFARGLPLIGEVKKELAIDIELFSRGGQEILNAIERQDFAVLGRRPSISKGRKLTLVVRAASRKILGIRARTKSKVGFDLQPILQGELLRLRPLRPEDFNDLYAVASDPLIWEQHPARDRYKEEIFRKLFRESLESGGALVAIDAQTGKIIGSSRFHGYDEEKSEIEIGWTFLARSHWGGVYNKEMKMLMLSHAFQFVRNVIFVVGPQNLRSQRAVEKIGGVRVGSRPDQYGRESFVYRISAP